MTQEDFYHKIDLIYEYQDKVTPPFSFPKHFYIEREVLPISLDCIYKVYINGIPIITTGISFHKKEPYVDYELDGLPEECINKILSKLDSLYNECKADAESQHKNKINRVMEVCKLL